jgi:catechol 2,3-dioxygenase-like lactoylglutathione lyase family enzyme
MGLSDSPVSTAIAVSDMDRAKEFYEGKLGLSGGEDEVDGGVTYPCADGTTIHPYPSPDNAGKSGATVAFWTVADVEATVDELAAKGVTFEQYVSRSTRTIRGSLGSKAARPARGSKTPTATSWLSARSSC